MEKTYKANPTEYFHAKCLECFHKRRIDEFDGEMSMCLDGGSFNEIIVKAKTDTLEEYEDEFLEQQTDHNAKVVAAFMEHCKQEGYDLPDSLYESYFGA